MNYEIKEILEYIKDVDLYIEDNGYQYKRLSLREIKILLDYITNLEKENENRISESLSYDLAVARIKELEQENKVLLEKYSTIQILYNSSKLKNDKAIEYILNNKLYCFKYDDEELFEITTDKKAKDELLNILQGGNK